MSMETLQQTRGRVGLSGFTGGRARGRLKKMEAGEEDEMKKEGITDFVTAYKGHKKTQRNK